MLNQGKVLTVHTGSNLRTLALGVKHLAARPPKFANFVSVLTVFAFMIIYVAQLACLETDFI